MRLSQRLGNTARGTERWQHCQPMQSKTISMDMNSEPASPTTLTTPGFENRAVTHGERARIERPPMFPDSAAFAQRNRKNKSGYWYRDEGVCLTGFIPGVCSDKRFRIPLPVSRKPFRCSFQRICFIPLRFTSGNISAWLTQGFYISFWASFAMRGKSAAPCAHNGIPVTD